MSEYYDYSGSVTSEQVVAPEIPVIGTNGPSEPITTAAERQWLEDVIAVQEAERVALTAEVDRLEDQRLALIAELDRLTHDPATELHSETVDRLRGERDQALALVAQLRTERAQFADRVVAEALDIQREMGWCQEGLRRHLANLDLEVPPTMWSATVYLSVDITDIEADNAEDATAQAIEQAEDAAGRYGYSVDVRDVQVEADD